MSRGSVRDKGDSTGDDGTIGKARKASEEEPVFFTVIPAIFYTEMLVSHCAAGVVDTTPGAGEMAIAALQAKLPYLGLCMTEEHCMRLKQRCVEFVKKQMCMEGSPFYAQEWKGVGQEATDAIANTSKFPKPNPPDEEKKGKDHQNGGKKKKDRGKGKKRKVSKNQDKGKRRKWTLIFASGHVLPARGRWSCQRTRVSFDSLFHLLRARMLGVRCRRGSAFR